jgi:acetyl esterase/lipase
VLNALFQENDSMRLLIVYIAGVVVFTIGMACKVDAQTLNIWPGVAPGSENWKQQERVGKGPPGNIVYNVVTPTLTMYLPEKSKATGTGVIVAPGGAFMLLSIDHEGHQVARWLQEKGIAAFVLKYRVAETPPSMSFGAAAPGEAGRGAAPAAAGRGSSGGGPRINMDEASRYGIADGIQALKIVRQHAAEWGIDPQRVGFMGFSAGAMVTTGTLFQEDAAARPDFAAPIYGGPFGVIPAIPQGLPPIFLAWAQDDTLAGPAVVRFYEALRAAGYKPEVHIFSGGGHGFGMLKNGKSSDHWIDSFYYWLQSQGLAKPAAK